MRLADCEECLPSDKSFEMSPRCTKGNSLVAQCSAAVFHKWMWSDLRAVSGFLLKEQKSIQNKTIISYLLGQDEFRIKCCCFFCWSHLTAPQVDGRCHSVSTRDLKVTVLGSHNPGDLKVSLWFLWQHQRDVEFLWSTVLNRKKSCWGLDSLNCDISHIIIFYIYLLPCTAVINFKPISQSSHCFHHLATSTASSCQ